MQEHQTQIYAQLLKIQNTIGGLDAKVDTLTGEVKALHRYERRLTRVETDVKVTRRIFGSLFTLLVAAGGVVANWLK